MTVTWFLAGCCKSHFAHVLVLRSVTRMLVALLLRYLMLLQRKLPKYDGVAILR